MDVNSQDEEIIKTNGKKNLGIFGGMTMIYGVIIGSGIFATVGGTLNITSNTNLWMVIIIWIVGGILALFGGFIYVELGMRLPVSGGDSSYYSLVLGNQIGATFIYCLVYLSRCTTIAALAITTGSYFARIFTTDGSATIVIEKLIGVLVVLICFIVNTMSISAASNLQITLTIFKTIALLIVIGCGIYELITGDLTEWKLPFTVEKFNIDGFFSALISVSFSYEGWNTLSYSIGEMKKPSRDLPISILGGVTIVIILYVLTVCSYITVLGFETSKKESTLALLVSRKFLKQGYPLVPLLVCFSAFGSANGNFFSLARSPLFMAYKGHMPKIFLLVHRTARTPVFTMITMLIVSIIFIPFDFNTLLELTSFVIWFFYFLSSVCLMILKFKSKYKLERNQKIVQAPVVIILLFQIYALFVVVSSFLQNLIGCASMLCGIIILFGLHFIPRNKFHFMKNFNKKVIKFFINIFDLEFITKDEIYSTS